jgi:hypothetical protein
VRKSSDIAMLLGSRGRRPSRSGFTQRVRSAYESWVGKNQWRREPRKLFGPVPGWAALIGVLAAFGGGYGLRGVLAPVAANAANGVAENGGAASAQLDTRTETGQAPTFLDFDTTPLTREGFVVAAYPGQEAGNAKSRAKQLAEWLRQQGFAKAKPYEYPTKEGGLWTVFVYYEGEAEAAATQDRLIALPVEVPDAAFVQLRKTENPWPTPCRIR